MSKMVKVLAVATFLGASLVPSIVVAQSGDKDKEKKDDQERVALFVFIDENEKSFERVLPDGQREPLEIPMGNSLVITDVLIDGPSCPGPIASLIIASSCIFPVVDPSAVQNSFLTRFDPAKTFGQAVNLTTGFEFPAQCPPVAITDCLGDLQVWAYGFLESDGK